MSSVRIMTILLEIIPWQDVQSHTMYPFMMIKAAIAIILQVVTVTGHHE